jgi:hypothetical protein
MSRWKYARPRCKAFYEAQSRVFDTPNISTATAGSFSSTLANWALRALSASAGISRIVPAEPRVGSKSKIPRALRCCVPNGLPTQSAHVPADQHRNRQSPAPAAHRRGDPHLKLSLVSCPIALHAACSTSERTSRAGRPGTQGALAIWKLFWASTRPFPANVSAEHSIELSQAECPYLSLFGRAAGPFVTRRHKLGRWAGGVAAPYRR